MANAWLDSLSEDWNSQPRSSESPASLPSPCGSSDPSFRRKQEQSTRIPISTTRTQSSRSDHDYSLPLSERSASLNNISLSQRVLRRSSQTQHTLSKEGNHQISRATSVATVGSVQRHTIQHKRTNNSPDKDGPEIPEWRRRLLEGDIMYGEQCDLFGPMGLENIFRPPPVQKFSADMTSTVQDDVSVLPSSPPNFNFEAQRTDATPNGVARGTLPQSLRQNQQRPIQYRFTEEDSHPFSENDLSRGSSFGPVLSASLKSAIKTLGDAPTATGLAEVGQSSLLGREAATNQRVISGQSDVRHEDLTPIFITHLSSGGSVGYSLADGSTANRIVADTPKGSQESSRISSRDITNNTEEFAHNGQFVNIRRGGLAEDGSFQHRMLSPSSLPRIDESASLHEQSIEASTPKQFPLDMPEILEDEELSAASPSFPPGPYPSPVKNEPPQSHNAFGSPLKLFGTYDTFTNQKLLRRLSQWENSLPEDNPGHSEAEILGHDRSHGSVSATEMDHAFTAKPPPITEPSTAQESQDQRESRQFPRFGEGSLDEYEFSEDMSQDSNPAAEESPNDLQEQYILKQQHQPSSTPVLYGNLNLKTGLTSTDGNVASHCQKLQKTRKTRKVSQDNSAYSHGASPTINNDGLETPRKHYGEYESKRLPKFPLKVSTPKRRRTLHKSDISHDALSNNLEIQSVIDTHHQMQSVIGRKRKDARNGDSQQHADAHIMATRQILRPRTHGTQRVDNEPKPPHIAALKTRTARSVDVTSQEMPAQSQMIEEQSIQVSVSTGIGLGMLDNSRKGSVTTQDFLDEAKKIMAGIRGKARPRSGLNSVEESESDSEEQGTEGISLLEHDMDESYEESTKEPFSRPPSRDGGGPLPRLPTKQDDPEILDHLRKYEELSDVDGIVSSMKSIALGSKSIQSPVDLNRPTSNSSRPASLFNNREFGHESDPPNIFITEYPDIQRKRRYPEVAGDEEVDEHIDAAYGSRGSNGSGQSTTHSIPTGSSRGSDSRGMILPPTISHLIPEQLAGMVFDREKRVWMKRKLHDSEGQNHRALPSDTSDDDPFGDIPDLTVDETEEMRRVARIAVHREEFKWERNDLQAHQFNASDGCTESNPPLLMMHPSENISSIYPVNGEGVPTTEGPGIKNSILQTSEEANTSEGSVLHNLPTTSDKLQQEVTEQVEEEISIHESRQQSSTQRRRHNVTISFSSPLASIIPDSNFDESGGHDFEDRNLGAGLDLAPHTACEKPEAFSENTLNSRTKHSFSHRSLPRSLSLDGRVFQPRPVSRIEERDEESFIGLQGTDRARRNVSLVITTPVSSKRMTAVSTAPNSITSGVVRREHSVYQLSPLSDFTLNQPDESFALEVSYARQRPAHVLGLRTLSLSIKQLVEHITDVEPYEPFWEHLKQLILKSKQLKSLHMLERFCSNLEELDASDNSIQQLDGAPPTIRHLQISHNALSDLTSWHQFSNLQYVDVSYNDLTSLEGFKSLYHLRSLRADNNKIRSLNGILHLDGLISLRLRDNLVDELQFNGSAFKRLTELDVKGNCVRQVGNLESLVSLATLNLEDNELENFNPEGTGFIWSLKYLKLSGNKIENIDIRRFPGLRLLYLDHNRLGRITGLLRAKHLDSLSLREQEVGCPLTSDFLKDAFEIRKLFLSGNLLTQISPCADFLNLQYLDLANCGLETLPPDFGQMMSNVRVLNLNFNALQDIKPLLGMIRLKKVYLAGNRLTRLRKTTSILAQFTNITTIDARNNPLTLGFYHPASENRVVLHSFADKTTADLQDAFFLQDADCEQDMAYSSRLDMATKMRRRVYEMLMICGCRTLKKLDGLVIDRSRLNARDQVWVELSTAGLIQVNLESSLATGEDMGAPDVAWENVQREEHPLRVAGTEKNCSDVPEICWQAEDSFA